MLKNCAIGTGRYAGAWYNCADTPAKDEYDNSDCVHVSIGPGFAGVRGKPCPSRRKHHGVFQLRSKHWLVSQFEIPAPTQTGPGRSASLLLPGGRKERAMPSDTELLGVRTHWKAPPCHGAHPERPLKLASFGSLPHRKRTTIPVRTSFTVL
jgi:hypothetical protein